MINSLTIFFPYYNQENGLIFQLENFLTYPEELLKKINIYIVDDGSNQKAIDVISNKYLEKLNITLSRINIDIKWNQSETNNLVFRNVETDYILRTDIDSYFNVENIKKIFNLILEKDTVYNFNRKYKSTIKNELLDIINSHPNTFLLPKNIIKKIKYNEYFSGNYGYEDVDFKNMFLKDGYKLVYNSDIYHYMTEYSTKGLYRDKVINNLKLHDNKRPFLIYQHKYNYILQIKNSKKIKIIGLMVTRNDEIIIEDWLNKYRSWFNELFVLDGSTFNNEYIKDILLKYNTKYYNEKEFNLKVFNDQSLRGCIYNEIQKYISKNEDNYTDYWIVIAHPDEFYLEDFDFIISKAYNINSELIIFKALHNLPHISEKNDYIISNSYKVFNHFIHNGINTYKENRIFKYNKNLEYLNDKKGVIPYNVNNNNSKIFFPNYLHYKILSINLNNYDIKGTIKKSRWSSLYSHFPKEHQFLSFDDFFLEKPAGRYENQLLYNKNNELPDELKIF